MGKRDLLPAALSALCLFGCGTEADAAREIDSLSQALNACDEVVPETRNIDGYPAYAQCPAFETGAIYSNNGIDTSATKVAGDWVQTQGSGGYQCTELAHRYWLFKWKVSWTPRGNAGTWCDTMPPATSGVVQSTTPVHGDLIVLAPGSCGASASTGHVAVVDVVDQAALRVTVVEQNRARRGTYAQSCGKCFLHITANDGTSDAGAGTVGMRPAPIDAGVSLSDAGTRPDAGSASGADATTAPTAPADAASAPDAAPASSTPLPGTGADAAVSADAATPRSDSGTSGEGEEPDDSADCSIGGPPARPRQGLGLLLLALGMVLSRRRFTRTAHGPG